MKSRVFIIPFCIFSVIVCTSYPLLAQVGGMQGGTPYNQQFPSPQGTTTTSLGAPQFPTGLSDFPKQQALQIPITPQILTPPSEPEPLSSIESAFQRQIQSLIITEQKGVVALTPAEQKQILTLSSAEQKQIQTFTPAQQSQIHTLSPADRGMILGGLRQFGYSLFTGSVSTFAPQKRTNTSDMIIYPFSTGNVSTFAPVDDVPVGPSYILGPGDVLRINIWGAMENVYIATVGRNGRIYLPTVGPIRVWGLTFSQAEKLIQTCLSQYYKGFQASITMGDLRTIKVYIVGEVNQPGSYTISALSTVTNALFASGGVNKSGSLRKIALKRNHHTVGTFDLYDFLLRGDKKNDSRLESGDVIFVPTIGPVVGIVGEVKRPAIYELKETMRASSLIDTAGGTTPQSYLKRVQIIRSKPNAERESIDIDLTKSNGGKEGAQQDSELQNGDLVRIYPTDQRIYNTVNLTGSVKHPGDYEIKPGMRLSQLILPEVLQPEAYLDDIEVTRFKEDLMSVAEIFHVSIKKAWAGDQIHDIILMSRDRVAVRSEAKATETVILEGEFRLPGIYTFKRGERLSSVINRAHGFTNQAYLKGVVFTRRTVATREKEQLDKFVQQFEESFLAGKRSSMLGFSAEQAKLADLEEARSKSLMRIIASRVMLGRIVIHLDDMGKFEGTQDDIMLEDGDTLTIPQQPAEVMIMGSVRNPTAVVHRKGENIEYYVNRGGGFSTAADKKEMYLLKADGSAIIGFLKLRDVDPGDAIVVPPKVRMKDLAWLSQMATLVGNTALTMGGLAAITR